MLRSVLLFIPVFGTSCGLPSTVDPDNVCTTYTVTVDGKTKTYGSIDVDTVFTDQTNPHVTLTISSMAEYKDHFDRTHPATLGPAGEGDPVALKPYDADNGRYVLTCEQGTFVANARDGKDKDGVALEGKTLGYKTLKLTVKRPKDWRADGASTGGPQYNYFGAEFVNMYKKDDWTPLRSEFEPFTFNDYGSKVPLQDARTGDQARKENANGQNLEDDSAGTADTVDIYMAAPNDGDFIFRYGNPNLVLGATPGVDCSTHEENDACGTWTALEFSKTLLRVGSPFVDCGVEQEKTVGAIFPVYLGSPNLDKVAYEQMSTDISTHAGTTPTYVVLHIFSPQAGNVEGMFDTDGKVLSATGTVIVENVEKWTYSGVADEDSDNSGVGGGSHDKTTAGSVGTATNTAYTKCYSSGAPCPLDHSVCKSKYCNVNRWGQIQDAIKGTSTTIKTLGYIECSVICAQDAECCPPGSADDCVPAKDDEGSPICPTAGCLARAQADIQADVDAYDLFEGTKVDGYYFGRVSSDEAVTRVKAVASGVAAGKKRVIATGAALLDDTLLTVADTVVTLTADKDDIKEWNPFAWYPDIAPEQFAGIVTGVTDVAATVSKLFDRGYGYVGMVSGTYQTENTHIEATFNAIRNGYRRLSAKKPLLERRLSANDRYHWACDDARFHCKPVCMRDTGFTTTIVRDELCADSPLDECVCNCLFDAEWTCEDGSVVCVATDTVSLEPKKVGDMVCATRGKEKPVHECTASNDRTAAEGSWAEALPRGSSPSQVCLARYETAKAQRESPVEAPTEAPTEAPVEAPVVADLADLNFEIVQGSAKALAVAALAAMLA